MNRLNVAGIATLVCALLVGGAAPAAAAGPAKAWDFNGDGRRDLAIGVAGENGNRGSVAVLRGTAKGLSRKGVVRLSQGSPGVPGAPESGDRFGAAIASADFDADGYADLAVAAPGEAVGDLLDVGMVAVLYGGPRGLSGSGAHALRRPERVVGETDREEANFGFHLQAGNFDGDRYGDLVVAVSSGRGGLLVYRGAAKGLARMPAQQIGPSYGLPDLGGAFPTDLAAGDLDGNGVTDLVAGWQESAQARGSVAVVYGAARGLDVKGRRAPAAQTWTEDSPGVKGVAGELDAFGSAVGVGDVTGDGRKDLVVGVLQQPTGKPGATGALHVLPGSRSGVTARGDQYLRYDSVIDDPVGSFGVELAVGDLDADGIADVAVTHGAAAGDAAGAVAVLYGSSKPLGHAGGVQSLTQATPGIGGRRAAVDYWGLRMTIRDVGKRRTADLIVADPYELIDGGYAGMVNVLWGRAARLSGDASTGITEDTRGVPGTPEDGDMFGSAL